MLLLRRCDENLIVRRTELPGPPSLYLPPHAVNVGVCARDEAIGHTCPLVSCRITGFRYLGQSAGAEDERHPKQCALPPPTRHRNIRGYRYSRRAGVHTLLESELVEHVLLRSTSRITVRLFDFCGYSGR
jgi:hypothetical protein